MFALERTAQAALAIACILICSGWQETAGKTPSQTSSVPAARADILSPVEESLGTALFFPSGNGIRIELDMVGLVPGTHAVHILSVGKCEGPGFKSAGPHFNPFGKQHGTENPAGPHAGDLPNFLVGLNGLAHVSLLASGVTLDSGPNSVFQPGGTAIVIDEGIDDYKTDPDGNSGAHIACGVVQKQTSN